jgi:titin
MSFFSAEKPSKPQGPLEVSDITEDHVKLSWKPPNKDGGSNLTAFIVEKSEAQRPRWLRVARLPPDTLAADVDNLIENKDYYFRVMAENEAGIGPALENDKAIAPKSKYGMYDS